MDELQRTVLAKLLAGEHPVLAALREQATRARIIKVEYTGAGFYCNFEVSPDVARVTLGDFELTDVNAEVEGLKYGAGFVLFIRSGFIDFLEGFSYEEPWPSRLGKFTLSYQSQPRALPFGKVE
jgi:hypothetical protein